MLAFTVRSLHELASRRGLYERIAFSFFFIGNAILLGALLGLLAAHF